MKTTLLVALALCASIMTTVTKAADVDGTWIVTIDAATGQSSSTLELKCAGTNISGTYKGQFGEAQLAGSLRGDDLVIEVRPEMQGVPLEVKYVGKVDGTSMTGTVTVVGFGEGTFKGIKQ